MKADPSATPLRQAITAATRMDEASAVRGLLDEIRLPPASIEAIEQRARGLVAAVRKARAGATGVDHLMQEFSLSSQEGVALMCLAEAMLRIPDQETVTRLIRDKLAGGDWRSHLGQSESLFVNAASWGLVVTGKLVTPTSERTLGSALTRLIARGGEPLIRRGVDLAMRMLGRQFVTGETIADALAESREPESRGYSYSYDMLGEAAVTAADAQRFCAAYESAIAAIGTASRGRGLYAGPGMSIKLSALHPRYTRAQRARVMAELLPRLEHLMALSKRWNIGLNIDAEEADRLDLSLDLIEALAFDPDLAGWDGLGFVVQAYLKRCPYVIDWLADLARRSRHRLMIRLVKGAYWDSEVKRAQVDGMEGYPVYTRKAHSDIAYLACAQRLLRSADVLYSQFATHNAHSLATVYQMAADLGVADYEFQCLHGMGEALYDEVVGERGLGRPCRIYAPVGSHETLLPYLVRRLLENGSNSSFVNRIVDEAVGIDELIEHPVATATRAGIGPHPQIPLPRDLFAPARINSAGVDLSNEATLAELGRALDALRAKQWRAAPMLAGGVAPAATGTPVINPADAHDRVGTRVDATAEDVAAALAAATAHAGEWAAVAVDARAAMLERAADLLEAHRTELMSLAIREAGKTWPNAVGEVREAADFCRYYAQQARAAFAGDAPAPLGVVACISPWNFPLAIFTGEVAAALAAGNAVIAKPAEQTPLIAARAVSLLHEAGIPHGALQLLPGPGETVGAALTADPRVAGVLFTGSTEVARIIHRTLERRAPPDGAIALIAETGGQNALVVDSSALPEQVVHDALASAFDSAGQRCSALRVLCVQEDIASRMVPMLREAMRELAIGDPSQLATDVGPVIDAEAKRALEAHVERMRAAGKPVFRLPLPPACAAGTYVAPTLIEIDAIGELEREVFGPVLHVVRFHRDRLDNLIDEINATGYGLTFGVHSRIDETIERATSRVRAGNVYVNRNIVGAVVGVQPFGGEGRSGTGPKAGGPLYLHALAAARDVAPAALAATRVESAGDEPSPLDELTEWAQATGRTALASLCRKYAKLALAGHRLELPGPTGEANSLTFVPRGAVGCIAEGAELLLEQFAAALATGNDAVYAAWENAGAIVATLPAAVRAQLRPARDWASEPVAVVLYAGEPPGGASPRALRERCTSERDGALVPVVPRDHRGRYPLHRLVAERTVSVNTTAAGGNAGLMTLAL